MNETVRFEFKSQEELSATIRAMEVAPWTKLPQHHRYFQDMSSLVTRMKDKLDWWKQSISGTNS